MTSGIIEILIENAEVQTLIGQDDRGQYKIYPMVAPQGVEQPYVTVSEVSLQPTLGKGCPSDLDKPTYNVQVYSLSFREAELIQEACRVALDTGTDWVTDACSFDSVYMIDRKDLYMQETGQGSLIYVKLGVYEAMSRRSIT
jgi:hypothetical protein